MMLKFLLFVGLTLATLYGTENDFTLSVTAWGLAVGTAFWMKEWFGGLVALGSVLWLLYIPGGF